jgi:hypothetical protein
MRDVVARFDFCSYLVVAVALFAAARQVAHHAPRFAPAMRWAAVATLLLVGGRGYAEVRPRDGTEVIAVAVVAWICASAAALAAVVLLPPFASLYDGWREIQDRREAEQKREEARRRAEDEEQRRLASLPPPIPPPPPPPPPPTAEERAAAARRGYQDKLRIIDASPLDEVEREAAREKAKQDLLRALDGVL